MLHALKWHPQFLFFFQTKRKIVFLEFSECSADDDDVLDSFTGKHLILILCTRNE